MNDETKRELNSLIKASIFCACALGVSLPVLRFFYNIDNTASAANAEPVITAPSCKDHMHIAYMIVTDSLKKTAANPDAVKFSKFISSDTDYAWSKNNPAKNECEMWISGWMQGTNGFGATIRKPWVATFTYDIPTDNLVAKDFRM